MYWDLIVIALCLLLLFLLTQKEIRRANKSWRVARVAASALAVISLACLALPVSINQRQVATSSERIILLTEGYNKDSLQKFVSTNPGAKLFTTSPGNKSSNASYVPDIPVFMDSFENIKVINIFGFGLSESELALLKGKPIIFYPATVENSITSVDWTQKLVSGNVFRLQGSFNNTSRSATKIILTGFNTKLDSTIIAANHNSFFELTTTPKHLDKAIYSIIVLSGKDTLEKEPVPVEVQPVKPLSILVIATSPDFENKFLKNWLTGNEYKFAVRTTISKNKQDKEYVNIPPFPLDRFTTSLLDRFDVIVADASELAALTASEIGVLRDYVESRGGGLIVKADNIEHATPFYLNFFPLTEAKDSVQHIIKLSLSDTSRIKSPLKTEQLLYIRNVAGTQPLVKDQHMRTVVNSKMYGLGKVILTTLGNTYTWQLAGNTADYTLLWSYILQQAAKKMPAQEDWKITPALPQKNEEVILKLQTARAGIPQAQAGEDIIYMEQNYHLPYEWKATYWPGKTGWQPLISDKGLSYWWYVFNNKNWHGVKAAYKIHATKKYARNHPYRPDDFIRIIRKDSEIPKIYFFILFLVSAAFLWFEKKLNNS